MGGGPGGGGRPGGGGGGRGGGFGGGPGGSGGFGASSDRKYSLTVGAQAQNLFNEVPYGIPVSTLTSPKFGQTLTIGGGAFASGNACGPSCFRPALTSKERSQFFNAKGVSIPVAVSVFPTNSIQPAELGRAGVSQTDREFSRRTSWHSRQRFTASPFCTSLARKSAKELCSLRRSLFRGHSRKCCGH